MAKEESAGPPEVTTKPWNDPKVRSIFFQAVLLIAVVLAGMYIFGNTAENLERQDIATGFDLIGTTAGFRIITHLID